MSGVTLVAEAKTFNMGLTLWGKVTNVLRTLVVFAGGFILGQIYYFLLLKDLPFPGYVGVVLSFIISLVIGISNVFSKQLRCISVLKLPMYCGKPGRGIFKAVILMFIVTGPITNMGLNAKEVVRVFACSTQLAFNISKVKYDFRLEPAKAAALGVKNEVERIKDAFRAMNDIIESLQQELGDSNEMEQMQYENDLIDDMFERPHRSYHIEMKFRTYENDVFDNKPLYWKKLRYRCENQISRALAVCIEQYTTAHRMCSELIPYYAEYVICWPLTETRLCDLICDLSNNRSELIDICEAPFEPGLGHALVAFQNVKTEFVDHLKNVHLQYRIVYEKKQLDIQDSKETAERVQHAFEEKVIVMQHVLTAMKICMALLFLRIFNAAMKYHDLYLTDIDYDNLYITGYFKRLDARRRMSEKQTLLPLKKMERIKYIDVYSLSYKESQRSNLMMQLLKVMLEVVTATTFVMLDRLFYEALEVVRQHAEAEVVQHGTRDFNIEVEGTGILATLLQKFFNNLNSTSSEQQVTNVACLPHPRQMPYVYFLKIYGSYTCIVILLFANPYTLRLKRLICSRFYPLREKQRILHLYNDILKNRMKMHKTLRRKAVQAIRTHYLSGDILSLLSLRMKFPEVLGWLRVLPAARMSCLICGETEPRSYTQSDSRRWYSCKTARCPFVYCAECWREAGGRCVACDPGLPDLSDVDSLTDD